ncbi:hypothetical protein J0835_01535 [Bacillus cereus group sp. Sample62]|uniref:reverse transcriptase domain-containing protein n=1 Tax=Bacillus cereus group TaxID=86661 RepID=UPI0008684FDB|nr:MULTISPECIES: reverse transcriptase domain-containing protein [Bacillus cereus group]SCN29636.1 Reverse transcriptase [Bacillus cereus]HDR4727485.1 hypothetical protein [Bacillus cereus]HDX9552629.1 hypothetical protein [Bacillus thuringiensis]
MNEKKMWYEVKYIRKKGKIRKIITYKDESIRRLHVQIKEYLEERLIFSKFTKAYVSNSSIFYNAKAHMYNDIFLKIDIKDFFNSINHKILLEVLYSQLNLDSKQKETTKIEISKLIDVCSLDKRGIPLGLVTSPILSNIYLKEFDNILYGKLKRLGLENLIYTRYADDLTISFKSISNIPDTLLKVILELVSGLLKRYKLKINPNKVSLVDLNISNHVRITGVSVTKDANNYRKISIGRKRINNLYHDAINMYIKCRTGSLSDADYLRIKQIKGMESFVYSVEKHGYDRVYSLKMHEQIKNMGFDSLSELIKNLPENIRA